MYFYLLFYRSDYDLVQSSSIISEYYAECFNRCGICCYGYNFTPVQQFGYLRWKWSVQCSILLFILVSTGKQIPTPVVFFSFW